ncbi:ABC transporter permease [Enterococcus alishanensis]
MNYLKRAWYSVSRRKGKSFILFTVVFVLGNVIAGAIAIQQSTGNVEKKMKQQLGATVSAEMDIDKLMEEGDGTASFTGPAPLKEETIKQIGSSSYVKDYDYSYSGYLTVDKFKTYQMKNDNVSVNGDIASLNLKGSNRSEAADFKNKKIKLVEGRLVSKDEIKNGKAVAVISKKVADENGLGIGDQMVIDTKMVSQNADGTSESQEALKHSIEIVGLFEPITLDKKKNDEKKGGIQQQFLEMDQFNTIYMSNKLVRSINQQEIEKGKELDPDAYKDEEVQQQITPIYNLKSPDDVEAFKEEMTALLPEGYKATASTDEFDKVGGSVQKLSTISGYVVILSIIASLLIISLVVVLFMRDRKHEWGIYLSLGERRKHIMQQVVLELLFISLVAMCLSLITGNMLGKLISESLVASDALTELQQAAGNQLFISGSSSLGASLSTEDVINNYQVKFSLSYIVTFLISGISTVLLSAILPLTYVMRLNPKKIMM